MRHLHLYFPPYIILLNAIAFIWVLTARLRLKTTNLNYYNMRRIILILILFLPLTAYSQSDSTTIYYKWIENNDIRNICDIANIQIQKVFCKDNSLQGKVFNLIIKEFKKGRIISSEDLDISARIEEIPMVVNGDTMIYVIDYTDKTGFGKATDSLTISFTGMLIKNNFKLKISFPGMSINKELKGKSHYSLRMANSCSDTKIRVPINSEYPILAYTPPFDTGSELKSYCMLGEENVLDWYDKFNVKHYYIIYLEIK